MRLFVVADMLSFAITLVLRLYSYEPLSVQQIGGANGYANSLNIKQNKVCLLQEIASITLFHYQYTCIVNIF